MTSPELPVFFFDQNPKSPVLTDSLHALFKDTIERALKLAANSGREIELEFRLGRPKSLNRESGNWKFDSTVDRCVFSELKSTLDANNFGVKSVSTVVIKDFDPNTRIRYITSPDASPIYQTKETINSIDQLFLSTPIDSVTLSPNVYMLRFALAEENNTIEGKDSSLEGKFKASNDDVLVVTRQRERYSYYFTLGGKPHPRLSGADYVFDLTVVDFKEYSIELEFTREFLSRIDKAKIKDKKYMFSERFFPPLKHLFRLVFPTLRTVWGISEVTPRYLQLIEHSTGGRPRSVGQPENIMQSAVPKLLDGYSFTNKLNGSRYRIMISNFTFINTTVSMIWAVSSTELRFIAIDRDDLVSINTKAKTGVSKFLPEVSNSLIDVELFLPDAKLPQFHAFDCPVFQAELGGRKGNITTQSHDKRMSILQRGNFDDVFNQIMNGFGYSFEIKQFFFTRGIGGAVKDLQDVLRYMYTRYGDSMEEDNDGLIMTPVGTYEKDFKGVRETVTKTYYDRAFPTYKWKFPDTVSIDFFLQEISSGQSRVFNLLVADQDGLVKFAAYSRGKHYTPPSSFTVSVGEAGYDTLRSGDIAELAFDRINHAFILLRIRHDKTEPNWKTVAEATYGPDMETEFSLSILSDILQGKNRPPSIRQSRSPLLSTPVVKPTIRMINDPPAVFPRSLNCPSAYRDYNNRVKSGIIQKWTHLKRVLDLGSGKGGDLSKYKTIRYLWAVEPNREYINGNDGFMSRLQKYPEKMQKIVEVINTGAENTAVITKAMMKTFSDKRVPDSRAGVVVSFFSLTFFFKDEATLKALVKTISSSLVVGGHFVGTMMDGQRTWEDLSTQGGKIQDPEGCYYLDRKYDANLPLSIGNEIVINLSGTPTVQGEQTEWLASYDLLEAELAKENIYPVENIYFDDPAISSVYPQAMRDSITTESIYQRLTPGENKLVHLYRYFAFEKKKPETSIVNRERDEQLKRDRVKYSLPSQPVDESDEQQLVRESLYTEPLYRVGVLGAGSCFYHSILFLLITKAYTSMKEPARISTAAKLRAAMATALSREMFRMLGNGAVEQHKWLPYLKTELQGTMVDRVIKDGDVPLVSSGQIDDVLAVVAMVSTIKEQIDILIVSFVELGYDRQDIEFLIEQSRLRLLRDYKTGLKDCSAWTSHDSMEYIMRMLGRNIFLIADSTRLPISFTDCSLYDPSRPSIIILNIEGLTGLSSAHFEPVIDLQASPDGKTISVANFKWDHPLIQSMFDYLCTETGKIKPPVRQ